jgi:hypothetical protein
MPLDAPVIGASFRPVIGLLRGCAPNEKDAAMFLRPEKSPENCRFSPCFACHLAYMSLAGLT